jgi:peroxiredoxin Q/BCP
MRLMRVMLLTGGIVAGSVCHAQTPAPAAQPDLGAKVGDVAPDFTLPGSTKAGKLTKPVHLSDLKGQVVVLAFFPKARTSG